MTARDDALRADLRALADEWTLRTDQLAPPDDWGESVETTVQSDMLRFGAERLRAVLDAHEPATELPCGSFGCTLPAGHNMGQADIPENHSTEPEAVPIPPWCIEHQAYNCEHSRGQRPRITQPATESEAPSAPEGHEHLGWWSISGTEFMRALRMVADGEAPEMVYAEFYANSRSDTP